MAIRTTLVLLAVLTTQAGAPPGAAQPAQPSDQPPASQTNPAHPAKKPSSDKAATAASPKKAPSMPQEFVKHGAKDPGTACSTARTDKNGQLDCGTHGKAATSTPKGHEH